MTIDYPDEPEMRVSSETIHQALYLQARGELKTQLKIVLRFGRVRRHPSGSTTSTQGSIRHCPKLKAD